MCGIIKEDDRHNAESSTKINVVVDANILFSAIISGKKNVRSKIRDALFSDKLQLWAPFRLLAELEKNRELLKRKSGFTDADLNAYIETLKRRVKFVPLEEYLDKLLEAKNISPDLKDIEYFALALKLGCPIWSEEKRLKRQDRVLVLTTRELVSLL
jgi:predicted nucleic acid-binding protein